MNGRVSKVGTIKSSQVNFVTKIAYLSREENRLGIIIPKHIVQFIDKSRVFQVTLTPLGSIGVG